MNSIIDSISIGSGGSAGSYGGGGTGGNGSGTGGAYGVAGSRSGNVYNNIIYNTLPVNLPDIALYTAPTTGTNIIGGPTIAGNYWPNYSAYNYLNFQNTSLTKNLSGYIPIEETKYQIFLGISNFGGDIYPLYDTRNVSDVSYKKHLS